VETRLKGKTPFKAAPRAYTTRQSVYIRSYALYALKPVSFRYNKEYDATQTLAFGLIG
jgi:hypothetical protein